MTREGLELAFLKKILRHRSDVDLKVYNDWLEELGDRRAEYWRDPGIRDEAKLKAALAAGVPVQVGLCTEDGRHVLVCGRGTKLYSKVVGWETNPFRVYGWQVVYCDSCLYGFTEGVRRWLFPESNSAHRLRRDVVHGAKQYWSGNCADFDLPTRSMKLNRRHDGFQYVAAKVCRLLGKRAPHLTMPPDVSKEVMRRHFLGWSRGS